MKFTVEEKNSVLKKYYIDYKANLISRNILKQVVEVMKHDKEPDDILAYFLSEIEKGNPIKRG